MSLETDVANLVTKTTDLISYFNGKKAGIDAAVAAAVAAVPAIARTFYVDGTAGDDLALGTQAAPMKTISAALSATPEGGGCVIILLKDYVLSSPLVVRNRRVTIRGDVDSELSRKLILNEYITSNGQRSMGGFQQVGSVSLELAYLTVSLPAGESSSTPINAYYSLTYAGSLGPATLAIRLFNIAFELRGTFVGKIVGPNASTVVFSVANTVIPTALEGSILPGVPAGTPPGNLSYLLTNLLKL
ncbi:hypothetical protein ACIOVF_04115 [Pseudomonas sp. NPDC087612]|uniref:hypothetical protein n=1 Tax=unclassified Pseudomonas TaxID=196821 RepID=UPI0005EBE7AB|nr:MULTISPECIES: hypothetical protein [unclassified Pseudomonas]KJK20356.1 hypothetical protein UB48_01050 [Pseudomonas sp. 2(2015)]SDQ95453.1 hypothetical protein SAMN05216487_4874 [Pseudomonas sp. UC 17F4]